MLNTSERAKDLKTVQKYMFAAYDLQLFLDTHPNDSEALKMYSDVVKKAEDARADFEKRYGPLSAFSAAYDTQNWQWNENPWPWDNADN